MTDEQKDDFIKIIQEWCNSFGTPFLEDHAWGTLQTLSIEVRHRLLQQFREGNLD